MALGATRMVKVTQYVLQEEKACPTCGVHLGGVPARRYCSRRCQNKAHWRRHAEEYGQRRRQKTIPASPTKEIA
jgi:endogenous inhibitor of DNA gyrase (YacG/DUF329 family)